MRFKFDTEIANVVVGITNYIAENNLPIKVYCGNGYLNISISKLGTSSFTFQVLNGNKLQLTGTHISWMHKKYEGKVRGEIVSVLESLGGVQV